MRKVNYERSVFDAIIRSSIAARGEGKTWDQTLAVAKKAGFLGGRSTLQKLVTSQPMGGKANRGIIRPLGNKNSKRSVEEATVASNAFVKPAEAAVSSTPPASAETPRESETLQSIQNRMPVLREGVQYARPISLFEGAFQNYGSGEIVAWSRILLKEEAVCVINSHDTYPRGGDILVDSELNPPGSFLTVIHASNGKSVGTQIPVQRRGDGTAFVAIRELGPKASLILTNSPKALPVRA